jgi:uncharacterized protein YeaO (DUF488 family)
MTQQLLRIKRVYEPPDTADGVRVLVDRLWPRGLSREKAKIDLWLKDIAPSDTLRRRFHGDPAAWEDFKTPIMPSSSRLPRSRRSAICSSG